MCQIPCSIQIKIRADLKRKNKKKKAIILIIEFNKVMQLLFFHYRTFNVLLAIIADVSNTNTI